MRLLSYYFSLRNRYYNVGSFQTDVSGTCRVNYAFLGAVQNAINVLKTRDLASCSNRYGKFHFLSGTPYHFIGPVRVVFAIFNFRILLNLKICYRVTSLSHWQTRQVLVNRRSLLNESLNPNAMKDTSSNHSLMMDQELPQSSAKCLRSLKSLRLITMLFCQQKCHQGLPCFSITPKFKTVRLLEILFLVYQTHFSDCVKILRFVNFYILFF